MPQVSRGQNLCIHLLNMADKLQLSSNRKVQFMESFTGQGLLDPGWTILKTLYLFPYILARSLKPILGSQIHTQAPELKCFPKGTKCLLLAKVQFVLPWYITGHIYFRFLMAGWIQQAAFNNSDWTVVLTFSRPPEPYMTLN